MRLGRAVLGAIALGFAVPAMAATVSAKNPESLVEALRMAGYEVAAGTDDTGDPVLDLVMQGYKARLLFLDCDEVSHDKCGSVQFYASFDAEGVGYTLEQANLFARRYRYAAISLSANGDPRLRWDIETGEGIPSDVFVTSAARFLGAIQALSSEVFPKGAG